MKPTTWLFAAIALLCLAGCSAASAEQATTESPTAVSKASTETESEADDAEAKPIPAEYAPPFPDNKDFFTPPLVDVQSSSNAMKNADGTPQVKLLGFVKIEGGADRAFVQIGPLTDIVEAGQILQGIEVISLQDPTMTLQLNGARWNVSMFDQPATTALASNQRGPSTRGPAAMRAPKGMQLPSMPQLPAPPALPVIPMPPLPM